MLIEGTERKQDQRGDDWTGWDCSMWTSDGLNIISGHGLFRNSLELKKPKPTI